MTTVFDLSPLNFDQLFPTPHAEALTKFLSEQKPDVLITGASYGDHTERNLWQAGKNLQIPSLAILDHWVNYKPRFAQDGKQIYPDVIILSDEEAKKTATAEGLPVAACAVLGNPYYEFLKDFAKREHDNHIREKYLGSRARLVTFASEPFKLAPKSYGYTEGEILRHLLHALSKVASALGGVQVVVRPHPKEDPREIENVCMPYNGSSLHTVITSEDHPLHLMLASDLVVGMISQFEFEAALLQRPALSVQIGLDTDDPFYPTKMGMLSLAKTPQELQAALKSIAESGFRATPIALPAHCMEKIYKKMEQLI